MILKEEMKARSGSYDNDPWGSARNSRSGSREMLHSMGHNNTVNGCKCSTRADVQTADYKDVCSEGVAVVSSETERCLSVAYHIGHYI